MLVRSTIGENLFIHKPYFFTIGCWIMVLWEMLFFWEESIHKCTIVGPIGMLKLYSFSSIPSFFLFLFNSPCLFLSCPFPSSILLFPSSHVDIFFLQIVFLLGANPRLVSFLEVLIGIVYAHVCSWGWVCAHVYMFMSV